MNSSSPEEGEEINELPYMRISRRQLPESARLQLQRQLQRNPLKTVVVQHISTEHLTAAKRIINAYNVGDMEAIRDIVYSSAIDYCEVYFSSIEHVFIGKVALFSLWASLFEAFPNGTFRTSDTVIDENKQVFTNFVFEGTKIFPLLIEGIPVELLQDHGIRESDILVSSTSLVVDRRKPMFNSAELLEADEIPQMVFEGRIILQMNERCQIQKFDFSWSRTL